MSQTTTMHGRTVYLHQLRAALMDLIPGDEITILGGSKEATQLICNEVAQKRGLEPLTTPNGRFMFFKDAASMLRNRENNLLETSEAMKTSGAIRGRPANPASLRGRILAIEPGATIELPTSKFQNIASVRSTAAAIASELGRNFSVTATITVKRTDEPTKPAAPISEAEYLAQLKDGDML